MKQQINLYQPIFRRQKKIFSAVTMLQISGLFLVVFVSISIYGQVKLQPLHEQYDKMHTDIIQLNSQLTRLEERQGRDSNSKLLENEIARLSRELAKRREIQDLLSTSALGNSAGLSAYMESLARQHVQGLWLTKISVANGGKILALQGRTQASELVPAYLERLAVEPAMNGMSFNMMELMRPIEPDNTLEFKLSTNP